MDIKELNQNDFVDLFPELGTQRGPNLTFGRSELNTDILGESTDETTTIPPSTDETTTVVSTDETTTLKPEDDADILGESQKAAGRKPKYDFSDASGYFADRIKTGKFVGIKEEVEGEEKEFIPKTPEEFDEFIDTQVGYQLEQKKKELNEGWYKGKSPAWQTVARYAEMVDDPTEIVPFLQGVRTVNSVANLDENEIDGAEEIVRTRLQQRGETDDLIDEQIESLKTTDRLISTAQKYKPLILHEEKQNLNAMIQQQQQEKMKYDRMVNQIRDDAIKAIEAPIFGKQKLKNDEKAAIYELIAEPAEESQGYPIYSAIDALFDNKDFETLKQIALLVSKKDAFVNYLSTGVANNTAEGLQRKLRISTDSRTNSGNDNNEGEERRPTVQRTSYGSPRFGRQ